MRVPAVALCAVGVLWGSLACAGLPVGPPPASTPAPPPAEVGHPSTPSGWTSSEADGMTVYRTDQGGGAELRLHAAVPKAGSLGPWFASRIDTAPDGITTSGYGEPSESNGVRMAIGRGTRGKAPVLAIALACAQNDGAARYAELIAPFDLAVIEQVTPSAAQIVATACADAAVAAGKRAAGQSDFPFAVPAGQGIGNGAIATVLYSWEQVYEIGGLQMHEDYYLLLDDGTVRDGLPPVPPDEFDAKAEKAARPERWGQWKKAWGGGYQLSWGGGDWTTPPGQILREPGRSGERLAGQYTGASSFQIPGGAGSWSQWGIFLGSDGRFKTYSSGGVGGQSGYGADTVVAGGVWDDKGSASSVSGPNFGGGGSAKTGVTDADLSGTYTIDGWSIELRYDSGRVRRSFFYTDDDRRHVYYDGSDLMLRKD